jgi:hypothetical protein
LWQKIEINRVVEKGGKTKIGWKKKRSFRSKVFEAIVLACYFCQKTLNL